jgi:elongation factor Ts
MFLSTKGGAADVSAIKKLREMSGAPMMDCKNALSSPDVGGDLQKALAWLRAKGIAKVASSSRATKEGLVGVHNNVERGTVTLVEVNCETDFVSINKDFQKFVAMLTETVSACSSPSSHSVEVANLLKYTPPSSVHTSKQYSNLEEALGDVIASIRETIVIKRAEVIAAPSQGGVLATYVHNKVNLSSADTNISPGTQLGKAAGVVAFSADSAEARAALADSAAGRKLAMHIVAAKPLFLSPSSVPQSFLDQEYAIFEEQTKDDKKKPDVLQKIIQGKVNKRLSEVCLLQQGHLAEEGNPVIQKYLETLGQSLNSKITVDSFALWNCQQE